ncbi:hypothetical protein TRFO_39065 [Tritrichomonas foetus]|uniref:MatE family protein n=1 Tax=Tritrichomonas foetus TaxID=1144522 RepID=A0A1J4J6B6_9EUKA|nr:hypothetical protein TRFO_39065 [Tritrichomonas foetus]|eukprot:OHS94774.1 hypothetical protein TRFO_39065 [Tritrichomonas foetus]
MNFPTDEPSVSSITMPTDISIKEENERFSKHKPLANLLILSVGPFLTTVGMAVLDSVDLIIVSNRFKNDPSSMAVQIIGIGFFILQICLDIGMYLAQALVVRLSAFIGEGRREEASQLTVDIFRISVISTILSTFLITFVSRPIMNFAGCTPELIEQCMLLIISTIAGLPIATFFHVGTGFLQGIGKPVLNGIIHLIANCLQTFMITPLLQYIIKIDVTMSNVSQVIAQSIIGIILFVLIFAGKFSLKPTFQMWFNPFCHDVKIALAMAIPLIPTFIYALVPSTLIMRYMTAAASPEIVTSVISVYTVFSKVLLMGVALPLSLGGGLITAGTHALAIGNYKRFYLSLMWMFIIVASFLAIFCPLMIANPLVITKLFVSTEGELAFAEQLIPIPFYTFPMGAINLVAPMVFITVGKPIYSTIVPLVQILSICFGAKYLSVKFQNDPVKIGHAYNICDVFTFLVTLVFSLIIFIPFIKKSRKTDESLLPAKTEVLLASAY